MKIRTEDFTDVTLATDDVRLGDGGGVQCTLYMEVDKVVDEVAKIKVDKVANMVMKKEGFADLTLTIDDTCGDGWVVMGVVDMEVANMVK